MSFSLAGIETAAAGLIQGIATGNTRQIVWPLTDQLGQPLTNIIGSDALAAISASGVVNGLAGYVAILEEHQDELEITSHPVSQGSTISDHAFKQPALLTMQIGWTTSSSLAQAAPSLLGIVGQPISPLDIASLFTGSGSDIFIRQIYQRFLSLQAQRTLLTIWTGKRIYQNMLIQSLSTRTTGETEHALILTVSLKEIILATIQTVQAPINSNQNAQTAPQDTTPTVPQGQQSPQPGPNFNPATAPPPPTADQIDT